MFDDLLVNNLLSLSNAIHTRAHVFSSPFIFLDVDNNNHVSDLLMQYRAKRALRLSVFHT